MPPITFLLYITHHVVVNTFPRPSDTFDIIEARHSRSVWVLLSQTIPNSVDIPFHVVDTLESTSEVVLIVVDEIMHKS